jgi:hypothetical protein
MARPKYRHVWEDLAYIDSDHMTGWDAFKGYQGTLTFDGFDPDTAEMEHDEARDVIRLFYVAPKGELVRQTIALERRRCTYDKPDAAKGGRVYFISPCCGRRIRKLALLPQGPRCARCGSITNRSKRKSGVQRLIHKADLLAGRLDCPNWYTPPNERPKGMRRATFNRLADEHAQIVTEAMRIIRPRLMRASRHGFVGQMSALLRYGM